jgi:hypothetical protein
MDEPASPSRGGDGKVGPDSSGRFSEAETRSVGMNPDPQQLQRPDIPASRRCNLIVMNGS